MIIGSIIMFSSVTVEIVTFSGLAILNRTVPNNGEGEYDKEKYTEYHSIFYVFASL